MTTMTTTTLGLVGALLVLGCGCPSAPQDTSPGDLAPLPVRDDPLQQTSGTVPHVQLDIDPDQEVVDELIRRSFLLPDLENRPTVVSLPGALGMWLTDEVEIAHPEVIVEGREFAHIHPDGSLHAPLPVARAFEVAETGWGERHPWADDRDGWEGFVMLFTPRSMEELEVTFQLVVESYNHVTGREEDPATYVPVDETGDAGR
ncbi:MAG: phospholipase [Deltaproteobacteria bacterium]|nr:phospholipase [Deltaproteobacteria bacterium]